MKRIALFGGTFDPIHLGHIAIAQKAKHIVGLDEVVFLPCSRSPFKMGDSNAPMSPNELRLTMLKVATKNIPWASVDDTDLILPPPSFSWRIAEIFHQKHPTDRLYWLMGEDQWNGLENWARWEYLASLVTFIVHVRGNSKNKLLTRAKTNSIFLSGFHPASSSEIRKAQSQGLKLPWLNPEVEKLFSSFRNS